MTNWNNPTGSSTYTNFITESKDRDVSAVTLLDGASDTNLPTNAKKYNSSTDKFQNWNGSAFVNLPFHTPIDNHIANTALHAPVPAGAILMWSSGSIPTGYLLCDGSAVSRTTYATLFGVVGSGFGAGDGSTTFNVPNFKSRFPIGQDAGNASCNTMAQTGGSFSHTHSTPNHQHTIPTHTHDLSNHVHGQPTHTHTGPSHTHSVPAHFHDCQGTGATIAITGGSHIHSIDGEGTTTAGDGKNTGNATSKFAKGRTTSVSGTGPSNGDSNSSVHTHAHAEITGTIGNTTGPSGDAALTSGSAGTGATGAAGDDNTFGPSINSTGASGTLTSNTGEGGGTTGSNNPPFITINFIIKT
jgi:microcystin-dependent protein